MIVRPAHADELRTAGQVCAAAYRADGFASTEYEQQLLDAAGRAVSAAILVAVAQTGRILGTVTYVASDGPVAEIRYDSEAELRMLAVDPSARRTGVGATLVRAAIHRAQEDALGGVVISTASQMRAAHRLYERLGFRRNAARDWSPHPGLRLDVYELPLRLTN